VAGYGLTRTQIIAQVLANLGDASNRAGLEVDLETRWLPTVLKRISNQLHLPEQEVVLTDDLLTGEHSITLDETVKKLLSVRLKNGANSKPIPIVSPTSFDRSDYAIIEGGTSTGAPGKCARFGETLEFSPIADDDYSIEYRCTTDLITPAADGAVCVVPGIDDIIIAKLTAYAYAQLGQYPERAAWWEGQGRELLQGHDSDMGGGPPLMRPYRIGQTVTTEEDRCLI